MYCRKASLQAKKHSFSQHDVGKSKDQTAKKRLEALNPHIKITVHNTRFTKENALELIEQYDIALTPGLQLLASVDTATKFNALTGGLTAARQGFSALPRVKQELEQINDLLPAQILIDDRFTRPNFQTQIENASNEKVALFKL